MPEARIQWRELLGRSKAEGRREGKEDEEEVRKVEKEVSAGGDGCC